MSAVGAAQEREMAEPEIILNLWYVCDDVGMIYSLLARCYALAGTEEEKLAFLRRCANTDYMAAKMFPIPGRLHTTFVTNDENRKMAVIGMDQLKLIGGVEALFEEVYRELDRELLGIGNVRIGEDPLVCITPLLLDDNNQFHPQTHKRGKL